MRFATDEWLTDCTGIEQVSRTHEEKVGTYEIAARIIIAASEGMGEWDSEERD